MRDSLLYLASRAYMLISRKPRIAVITIHRVGGLSRIQPCHVEWCFRFLKKHFRVIRPSELALEETKGRVGIVTIDDGHADSYQHIFPIARAMRIPLSICISTDFFFRGKWLWFDKILWAMNNAKTTAAAIINSIEVSSKDPSSFRELLEYLKTQTSTVRDNAIKELLSSLDLNLPLYPPEEYRSLTTFELQEMLSSGLVEVIGHTVTHTIATVLDHEGLETELGQSSYEWESFCGQPATSFCYPNGEPGDFDVRTALAVRKAGYHYAFTSLTGTNLVRTMNPLEIKRVHIHSKPGICATLLSGLADFKNSFGTLRPKEAGETETFHR